MIFPPRCSVGRRSCTSGSLQQGRCTVISRASAASTIGSILPRGFGFKDVEVIDDDIGVSANGSADRAGFKQLGAQLCAGVVGAVLSSRPPVLRATAAIRITSSNSTVSSAPG